MGVPYFSLFRFCISSHRQNNKRRNVRFRALSVCTYWLQGVFRSLVNILGFWFLWRSLPFKISLVILLWSGNQRKNKSVGLSECVWMFVGWVFMEAAGEETAAPPPSSGNNLQRGMERRKPRSMREQGRRGPLWEAAAGEAGVGALLGEKQSRLPGSCRVGCVERRWSGIPGGAELWLGSSALQVTGHCQS